ncbi:MAG: hypothetical protein HYX50_06015, partial [Chloroflexi bacterium]|nr:hypothetical protein [Chloroflexota bacterium]
MMLTRNVRRIIGRPEAAKPAERGAPGRLAETAPVDIAPGDPLLAYFQQAAGAVEIDRLEL